MSYKTLAEAWEADLPNAPQKLVLISLADQSNDEGKAWPSVSSLMKRTGLCERSIQIHLNELEKAGHLTRDFRLGRSTTYVVHPVTTPAIHCTPANVAPPKYTAPLPPQPIAPPPAIHCTGGVQYTAPRTNSELSRNRKPKTKDTPAAFDAAASLSSLGVDRQVAADWIAHRKHLKTAISQTAINLIAGEAEKADMTLTEALSESVARGWRGFKAAWVAEKSAPVQQRQGFVTQHDRNAAFMATMLAPLAGERDVTPNVLLLGGK